MKKITSILLGAFTALGFVASAITTDNTVVTLAEENTTNVVLSETKYKVSDDYTKMLLVTAIQNVEVVYEVGYEFSEGYSIGENAVVNKTQYYESITTNVKQTAEDIFGEAFADAKLIIWEVAYAKGITFNAYAKQGVLVNNQLIKPNEEIKVVNPTKAGPPQLTAKEQAGITAIVGGISQEYHGQAKSIKASGNNVAVATTTYQGNFRGFTLTTTAAKALLDLGYNKMKFTIASDAPFVDIYNSTSFDIVANYNEASATNGKEMFFANGSTVILDLQAIYRDSKAVKFVLCSTNSWVAYNQDGSMTFTNIEFVEKPSVTAFTSGQGIFTDYGEAVAVTAGTPTYTDTTATTTYNVTVDAYTYTFVSFESILINKMIAGGYTKATVTVALPSARYIHAILDGTGLTPVTKAYGSVASIGFDEFALTNDGSYNVRFYFGETTDVTVTVVFSK